MALSYVGVNKTPKEILEKNNGYTVFDGGWGADYITTTVAAGMSNYINGNGKYSPVVIHLPGYSAAGHFVILAGKVSDNVYTVVDPAKASTWNITINGTTAQYNSKTDTIDRIFQYYNANASRDVTITFDANGGSCSTGSKSITSGSAIGTLPTASRSGYDFIGWTDTKDAAGDLVTSSTTFSENTTLYAHYANRLYTGNKINFDANGGTLPAAVSSKDLTGFNVGRGYDHLVVYNSGGETVGTNYYGAEVAVDSDGKVTKIRAYGDSTQISIPNGGFVLSGHHGGSACNFVEGISIGDYVAYDKNTMRVYVYDSEEAYQAHHKYLSSGDAYGTLPTPTGSDNFMGWFTSREGGKQITADSVYSASTLYAHWGCSHSFDTEIIPATCEDYEKILYTCTECGYTYTEYAADAYSEWSTTKPSGVDESLIETKTQYRYSDYETTTSYSTSLDGWTRTGSSWQQSGTGSVTYVKSWPSGFLTSHGLYSTYNKSPKSVSETETDKTTINSDNVTGYLYYHWCRGTYTAGPINRGSKSTKQGEFTAFHAFYSTTNPNTLTQPDDHDGSYQYSNGSCCKDSYWYFYTPVYTQSYTTYKNLFSYERWTDWSDWSDTAYTASNTRKVETQTLYRYSEGASAWSEEYPDVSADALVQSKTQYRYADQKTVTSYEPSLDGYTVVGSSWQQTGTGSVNYVKSWPSGFSTGHSLYSTYNKSPKSAAETTTDKTTINSDSVVGYLYYHWCRGTYTAGPINRQSKSTQQGEFTAFHAFYSTTNPSSLEADDDGSVIHSNGSCCTDSYWYFYVPVYKQSYTTYKKLFTHAYWSDWSDWSDTIYTASDTRKVETRTLYRTITSELGEHSWDDGFVSKEATCTAEGEKIYTCLVCGDTKTEILPAVDHSYSEGYCIDCGGVDPDYNFIPVVIGVENVSGYPGDTIVVPVTITNNPGFAGFTLVIDYDASGMKLTNIAKGALLQSSESGAFTKNVSGATINWTDYQNTAGDGTLLELTFAIHDEAAVGSYDICLSLKDDDSSNFVDEDIRALHTAFEGGTVTVEEENSVIASGYSGDLTWELTGDGVLTFNGSGAMKNYEYKSEMPWYSYLSQITTVVLEDGVTSIGNYAFYGMPALQRIVIPESVTSIGSYAFKNSTALDGVTLPSGLTKLGESAFYGCTSLSAIEIPDKLYTIQPYTFKNCTALADVTFHEGNLMKLSDGAFYGTALTEVTFPACLDIIDVYCFKNCTNLAQITLREGDLTQIREAVFYGTAISTINIPEGVTKIGPYAFKNCVNLEEVNLPDTLTSVGEASFYANTALKAVSLPDAVTSIGDYAFRKCIALENVEFPDSLVTIGESSFYGCESIPVLDIPDKVTTIKGYAFKGCTGLQMVALPESLVTLGESAFHTCSSLTEIEIPDSVDTIGAYCFSGSSGIDYIYFYGDAPSIGSGAFNTLTATAYYPGDNATWTSAVKQNYGGSITWTAN